MVRGSGLPYRDKLSLTPEIERFLATLMSAADVLRFKKQTLAYRGVMQEWALRFCMRVFGQDLSLRREFVLGNSPWPLVLMFMAVRERTAGAPTHEHLGYLYSVTPTSVELARLLIVLTVQLKSDLVMAGLELRERLIELLRKAEKHDAADVKQIGGRELLNRNLAPDFCHLPFWETLDNLGTIDFRKKGKPADKADEPQKRAGQQRAPHRLAGVTRKKRY